MNRFYLGIAFSMLLFLAKDGLAQGCFPDPSYISEPSGLYPEYQMVKDCSGLNSKKTFVTYTDSVVQITGLSDITLYYDAFALDTIIGLPAGLNFTTDVASSAPSGFNYGIWTNPGFNQNISPTVGCISVFGDPAAWEAASAGGVNNDGVFSLQMVMNRRIGHSNPDINFVVPNGSWASSLGALDLTNDTINVDLNVNLTDCDGQLFAAPVVIADDGDTPECDGFVEVAVYNGTPPYQYSFSTGDVGSDTLGGLCPGIYTVYVEDAAGSEAQTTFAVSASSSVFTNNTGNWPSNSDSLYNSFNDCDLDFNLPVDSFEIVSAFTIGTDTCLVTWSIYQNGNPFIVETYYPFIDFNPTVFSLILYCENGRSEAGIIQIYDFMDLSLTTETSAFRKGELSMFPNPTDGNLHIANVQAGDQIKVLDLTGRIVYKTISLSNTMILDLNEVENGKYVLIVENRNTLTASSLIVQR